ncbi:MAG TPA: bifunctional metallophosphatase/5'-nucleotidase [Panacibacter sp.]|nr:bifunctional metallophosphatase/5'-nucleotidase [Panacibacter sp.]
MKYFRCFIIAFIISNTSCKTTQRAASGHDDGKIEITFVQVNDVYEIAPLANGTEGGMARVAALKQQYIHKDPNTILIMAGDFVSPSVYNSLKYEGRRIRGKQMTEAMNAAGFDIAIFGNHEFDIAESELQNRINESNFLWVSSNSFHKQNDTIAAFAKEVAGKEYPFPKTFILALHDKDGTPVKIGFIGLTLPFNKANYVSYTDPLTTAKELYSQIKDSVDAVIAITHQSIEDDEKLAKEIPGLALIIGGHEHDMRFEKIGNIYITKAHANAKSAYVIQLSINKNKGKIKVDPKLIYLDQNIPLDSSTNAVVQKWTNIADSNYSSLGFDANKVLIGTGEPLDGRESQIRSHPTNLTRLVIAGMADAVPNADAVLLNAGSIRVDDILQMPLTEYDMIRTLPFGGDIREADMKGSLLLKTLDQGRKNAGIGGFLLYSETVSYDAADNTWKLNNTIIDAAKTYHVAMGDFLFSGKEANLDFLHPNNPEIVKTYDTDTSVINSKSDIRLAVIRYLEKTK